MTDSSVPGDTDKSGWLRRLTGRWIVISALAMVLIMVVFLPRASARSVADSPDATVPDVTFFYAPAYVFQFAEIQGRTGREHYVRDRLTLDIAFPLSYGLFIASSIAVGLVRAFPRRPQLRRLGWLGVAAMLADIAENLLLSAIMLAYPTRWSVAAGLAAVVSGIKWILVVSGMALALFSLAAWGWTAWRRRGL